jgi:phosphoribosylformylglycinamidine (FGAM) synthase PurS component
MAADPLSTPTNYNLQEIKSAFFENLRLRLGGDIIDLELDPQHYEAAYNYAIKVYRQRAQNATIESYSLMTVIKNVDTCLDVQ